MVKNLNMIDLMIDLMKNKVFNIMRQSFELVSNPHLTAPIVLQDNSDYPTVISI